METSPKRERWTEADTAELPLGEPDYFDRKSGRLFDGDKGVLLGTIAKALCAFANSGGGHLLLGVTDDGSFDGVPQTIKGSTCTREWLEQKVPNLLAYPLSDFRVHVVERDQHGSRIPADRDVIVIDVGDSALAPHQCVHDGGDAAKYMYYMRQGGHSVPAPHFYVELLRQRLTNAALTATPSRIVYVVGSGDQHAGLFALLALRMIVENVGRVAAYKWQVQWVGRSNLRADRPGAYLWDRSQWPINDPTSGIRVDDTILPGGSLEERLLFGVHFPPEAAGDDVEIRDQLNYLLDDVELEYRIATETGISEVASVRLGDHLDATGLAKQISTIAI